MNAAKKIDLGLKNAYDELFMDDKGREENRLPRIHTMPLSEIDDFPDHPFQVRLDEDMDQLVESVKSRGIITPITIRPKEDGRYEIVSGHRRKKACELAGLETIPAEVKELTRDEAVILMVESNLQRSNILPSEKAFSYKMKYDALKRVSGTRTDLTCDPLGPRLRTSEMVANESPDSATQVKRYIRLTELVPGLLNLTDDGRIALRPAVELSYLTKDEQADLVETIAYEDATPSLAQAIKMRQFSNEGKLDMDRILSIMSEAKPNQREKLSFQAERLKKYIPAGISLKQTEDYVVKALEFYQRYLDKQRVSTQEREQSR